MPIYEYQCSACAHELEAIQKFSDPVLVVCPACGKESLRKLVSAAGFQLKGSGWYQTDFRGSGAKPPAKTSENGAGEGKSGEGKSAEGKSADTKSEGKTEGKSESKSESKSDSKSEGKSEIKSDTKSAAKSESKGSSAPSGTT